VAQCRDGDFGEEIKEKCLEEWIPLLCAYYEPRQKFIALHLALCHIAIH
jgi:hypothetical protein